MNKKNFVIFTLVLLLLPMFVSAQSSAEGLLGGIDSEILKTVVNIINYQIPLFSIPGYIPTVTVPLWLLISMFVIVYSILWVASGYIPLFTDDANRKPRIAFSVGITLITIFLTPIMVWILRLIKLFTTLSVVAILLVGGFMLWALIRSGWASGSTMNSEASKTFADAKAISADAARKTAEVARQNEQTHAYEHKTAQALSTGLHQQTKAIEQTRKALQAVVNDVNSIKASKTYPPTAALGSKLAADMNIIRQDLGKISSFMTQNDRLMATMSSKNYKEVKGIGSIGSTTAGSPAVMGTPGTPAIPKGLVEIKKKSDSETSDLGRTLTEMSSLIIKGITSEKVANRTIELGLVGVNIMQRMEKDIVLEAQMIDKI